MFKYWYDDIIDPHDAHVRMYQQYKYFLAGQALMPKFDPGGFFDGGFEHFFTGIYDHLETNPHHVTKEQTGLDGNYIDIPPAWSGTIHPNADDPNTIDGDIREVKEVPQLENRDVRSNVDRALPSFDNPDLVVTYQSPSMSDFFGPMPQFVLERGIDYMPRDETKKPDGIIVVGIDPSGANGVALCRMLVSNKGYTVLGVETISLELSEREILRLINQFDESHIFRYIPEFPVMVHPEEVEPKPKTHGPKRKSKHQRGKWWNK